MNTQSDSLNLARNYKAKFVTSSQVDIDLKLIKKINTLFNKLEKTNKEIYALEIVNIITILNNTLHIERILSPFFNLIEMKYHVDLEEIIYKIAGVKNVDQ